MSHEFDLTFDQLAEIRRELVQDVRPHRDSVNYFASTTGFFHTGRDVVQAKEAAVGDVKPTARPGGDKAVGAGTAPGADSDGASAPPMVSELQGGRPHGITTAFTCFESLNEAMLDPDSSDPAGFAGLNTVDRARITQFTENALSDVGPEAWRSELSARRYCIVRALPPLVGLAPNDDRTRETGLIREVWGLVGLRQDNCGVFEVAPLREHSGDGDEVHREGDNDEKHVDEGGLALAKPQTAYPPNAFLTYWALKAVRALNLETAGDRDRRASVNLWLRAVVGRELALHASRSRLADPQQLAWAIAGIISESETPLADQADGTTALIEAGVDAFFAQQSASGTWDTGRPLFHYLSAGNAYCYIYETLAELLALGLDPDLPASAEIRRLLLAHLPALLQARAHLAVTSRPLGDPKDGLVGWSSGHHPHRTSPESWATATAFRFLQGLRRLIGLEVRARAESLLQARRPKHDASTLAERGRTWDVGDGEVGYILNAGFVAPIRVNNAASAGYLDSDLPRIPDDSPRSAILFGPPGTGKTTLAEAVAGAIGWNFVEVTSADFLSGGSDQVSARADEIFRQLMELDQVVVLFDEVDELIRRRSGPGEMAGRFFTTTMLPRLSRLWDRRRTVFFLNTNGINQVDPAVRRSQRFDAALLVMPPSFEAKVDMLPPQAKKHFDKARLVKLLDQTIWDPSTVSAIDAMEGWFAFLRYDQVRLLEDDADRTAFLEGIARAGAELPSDWELAVERNTDDGIDLDTDETRLAFVVRAFQAERRHQRLDTTFRFQLDHAQQADG